MTWQVPWIISGVDEISLETARVLAYVATGGNEGIVDPDDLKVTALSTPGASVNIAGGAFVANNRFVAGSSESYIGRNTSTVNLAVSGTSASPRSDLIYAHIVDPGQPGQPGTPGPVETRVVTNVASTVTSISQVGSLSGQAGYALARIDRPGSTSTVQNSHIVDLRRMASTLTLPAAYQYRTDLGAGGVGTALTANSPTFSNFPPNASWQVYVPAWSNKLTVSGRTEYLQIQTTTGIETATFTARAVLSTVAPGAGGGTQVYSSSQTSSIVAQTTPFVGNSSLWVSADIVIPSAMRGTPCYLYLQAAQPGNPNVTLKPITGTMSSLTTNFVAVPE